MLVDINLLPKRDEKNIAVYVIAGGMVILLIIVAVVFSIYLNGKKQDIKMVEQQISMNQEILAEQHKKLAQYQSSKSVVELENAINWAKNQPYNMVYVIQELTKSLPQSGFMLEFQLDEENVITERVQFDTKSDAAYYLNAIAAYPWVDEAVISEAKTSDILKNDNTLQSEGLANSKLKEEDIVPRYFAEYEVRLDVPQVQNASNKQKKAAVGGEGGNTP
ncbi:fimbrial assembly protein [Neobacillus sp. OS1-2]|uniref:fimbrial assembly protein n=1 Tax=Neobacillus sp. OS1-2 TaxID=3070680 RepID=UPI0027E1401C|nr:fimbrial assembly protein [Neobacillus sp. OS1-2]WML40716.1 fimbrial assembly protein [Neobacillus sp. OS1-2]